jgi:hypothetical protein
LASRIELFVPSSEDFEMVADAWISWGDVTNSRMQAHGVVMGNKALYQAPCIFDRQRAAWA